MSTKWFSLKMRKQAILTVHRGFTRFCERTFPCEPNSAKRPLPFSTTAVPEPRGMHCQRDDPSAQGAR